MTRLALSIASYPVRVILASAVVVDQACHPNDRD